MTASALILAGGSHGHDFPATARSLSALLTEHGYAVDTIDDPDDVWSAMLERPEPYDLLAVNGLRFRMTHERYDTMRAQWAYRTPRAADAAMDRHLASGGAIFSVHTGCICFDDWDRWSNLLGRRWSWDEQRMSWHPERGQLHIEPVTGHGAPFDIVDEVYTDMVDLGGVDVWARCDNQPVMWRHEVGGNRIAVTTLGHGTDSYENRAYRQLLDELVSWLAAG